MRALTATSLAEAQAGSYYTILGTADPIREWLEGYEKRLLENEIGRPQEWLTTTGREVNAYAALTKRGEILAPDKFQDDLPILMFPLDGLNIGRLAIFRLRLEDRWFDDMIDNMRVVRGN